MFGSFDGSFLVQRLLWWSRTFQLTLLLLIAPLLSVDAATASETTHPSNEDARVWMPDVAERVEELRQRYQRSAEDSSKRQIRKETPEQWWRVVAAAPPARVGQ